MKITWFILLCFMSLINLSGCGEPATITYKVIDEQGVPIAKANVHAGYMTGGGWSGKPIRSHSEQGTTNTNGFFVYKARVKDGVSAKVSKEGYYGTYTEEVNIWDIKKGIHKASNDPLMFTLKKKINPVQMYAKNVNTNFPKSEGTVGYDLVAGDFVYPYGSGKIKDFIFHISYSNINITFSNKDDGIQPFFVKNRYTAKSELISDQLAPTTGYFKSLKDADEGWHEKYEAMKERAWKEKISFLGERAWMEEVNYYFRVRSNKGGNSLYGKIYGFFRGGTYGKPTGPQIEFTYYLNPDGTNNVEFARSFFPSSPAVGFENPPGPDRP